MDRPSKYSATERLATSAIVAIIGGLLLAKAAAHSLDRSIVLWLPLTLFSGVVLGTGKGQPLKALLKHSLVPALLSPFAFLGYLVVRAAVNWARNTRAPRLEMLEFPISGPPTAPPNFSEYLLIVGVLTIVAFVASSLVVFLSSISSRMLVDGVARLFELGPEGVEKASRILVAAAGLVAALFAVWAAVSN